MTLKRTYSYRPNEKYITEETHIVLAGDLNVYFDSKLQTKGGKSSLRQKSVAKVLEIKVEYDLCNI